MKKIIVGLVILVILGLGIYLLTRNNDAGVDLVEPVATTTDQTTTATSTDQSSKEETVIGKSVEGRDIVAYHYGQGEKELLFVAGTHGGYSWNTTLLAYELTNYLKQNSNIIPANIKVTVIPVLNPDGLNKVVGTTTKNFSAADVPVTKEAQVVGRFNANKVDLNRNFDCDWQAAGTWQSQAVSGGSAAFSEPESRAIRDYVKANKPVAVVAWYSAAGGVYASSCHNGVSAETAELTNKYAEASGYPPFEDFDFYSITGDMINWLSKENIPAISVVLTNHTDTEWAKNRSGIEAILKYYAK